MDKIQILASFCSHAQSATITQAWTSACATFQVATAQQVSVQPGDSASVGAGVGATPLQIVGYVDTVEYDKNKGLYVVSGRDSMRRAVDYFLAYKEDGEAEYVTVGADAAIEVKNILALAGLTASTYSLGYALKADFPFALESAWDAASSILRLGQWRAYATGPDLVLVSDGQVTPGTPVDTFVDDETMLDVSYAVSAKDTLTKVVVTGLSEPEGEEEPELIVAVASGGALPWSKSAYIHRDWINSQGLAQQIANANISLYGGLTYELQVRIVGHETRRVGDTVTVVGSGGIAGDWIIYSLTKTFSDAGAICNYTLRK